VAGEVRYHQGQADRVVDAIAEDTQRPHVPDGTREDRACPPGQIEAVDPAFGSFDLYAVDVERGRNPLLRDTAQARWIVPRRGTVMGDGYRSPAHGTRRLAHGVRLIAFSCPRIGRQNQQSPKNHRRRCSTLPISQDYTSAHK
jgi:hypothetical protein